jgi:hypothetical protein
MLSVIMLSVIMLSVIMLSVIMLSAIMLNVILLSVVAPSMLHYRLRKHPISYAKDYKLGKLIGWGHLVQTEKTNGWGRLSTLDLLIRAPCFVKK